MEMTPRINPNDMTCPVCYWFRAENDDSLNRSCTYKGSIKFKPVQVEVRGEPRGLRKSVCAMWEDCGLIGSGYSKPIALPSRRKKKE